ncbi:hypothetical protein CORMATOL_01947 [Corynebacterium matruchotii ATCC 33806]|uniref:Uncharacterized protein n=1 Tax=Corynebacterium matruchotii ATCC 33806 TaxID=566549 RepID=C0E4M2_9CORY|nr:hypothetical protein CORMATOL_01947 [Corynebacterium matruchotii ATCC 33806]
MCGDISTFPSLLPTIPHNPPLSTPQVTTISNFTTRNACNLQV